MTRGTRRNIGSRLDLNQVCIYHQASLVGRPLPETPKRLSRSLKGKRKLRQLVRLEWLPPELAAFGIGPARFPTENGSCCQPLTPSNGPIGQFSCVPIVTRGRKGK